MKNNSILNRQNSKIMNSLDPTTRNVFDELPTLAKSAIEKKLGSPGFRKAIEKIANMGPFRGRKPNSFLIAKSIFESENWNGNVEPVESLSDPVEKTGKRKRQTRTPKDETEIETEEIPKKRKTKKEAKEKANPKEKVEKRKKIKPRVWQRPIPVTPLEKMIYTNLCANELCRKSVPKTDGTGFGWPGAFCFDRTDSYPEYFHPVPIFFQKQYQIVEHANSNQGSETIAIPSFRTLVSHPLLSVECLSCKKEIPSTNMTPVSMFVSYNSWMPLCDSCSRK